MDRIVKVGTENDTMCDPTRNVSNTNYAQPIIRQSVLHFREKQHNEKQRSVLDQVPVTVTSNKHKRKCRLAAFLTMAKL